MRRTLIAISLFIAGIGSAQTHTVDVQYQTQRMYAAPPYTYQVFTNAAELDTYVTNVPTRAYAGQAVVLVEAGVPTAYMIGGTTGALTLVPTTGATAWAGLTGIPDEVASMDQGLATTNTPTFAGLGISTNRVRFASGTNEYSIGATTYGGYGGDPGLGFFGGVTPDQVNGYIIRGGGLYWDHIISAPRFGATEWIDSVDFKSSDRTPGTQYAITSTGLVEVVSGGSGNLSATNTPTAGQMLYASDATLTNLYFAAASAVATNDARYLASLTNAAAFATAAQGTLADTAWQNPANVTNWTWTSNGKEITLTSYTGPNDVVIPDMLDGLPVTGFGTTFSPEYLGTPITSVGGGANITSIGEQVFSYCLGLTSVALPNATSIGEYAFYGCDSLTSVALPNATSIGNSAFYGCDSLTSVALPNATSIGEQVFYYCLGLTSVALPNATSIGEQVFYYCLGLTSVALPNATSIGEYAFSQCTSLTSVYMGQNAPAESTYVFDASPNATIYVTNPQATGWTNEWNGRPVVRMPLATDSLTLGGVTRTNWPSGGGTSSTTNWIAANVIQSAPTVTITGTMKSPLTLNLTNNTILSFDYASFPPTVTGLVVQAVTYQPNAFSFGLDTNTMSGTLPTPVTNGPNFITISCPTGMGTVRAEVR